jgi:hypothetical protein
MEENVDGGALATVKKILAPIDRSGYKEQILAFAISIGKAWRVKEKEEEREEEAKRDEENLLVQSVDPLAQKEGIGLLKNLIQLQN